VAGVPVGGDWRELLNSDAHEYGGSGVGNMGGVTATPDAAGGHPFSVRLTVPPLGCVFLGGR
jgi:1,4-alpha-glucan branching enzyme